MELSLYPSLTKEEWNRFVLSNGGSFLQSWEWGEFQKKSGRGLTRATVKDGKKLLLLATFVHHALPFTKWYWYVPYGPVYAHDGGEMAFGFFVQEVRRLAPANVVFLKVEPDLGYPAPAAEFGFVKAPKDVQAGETMIMDLSQTEARLLSRMKQKTRYNIRVAERHGVKIISPDDQKSLDTSIFLSLQKETARRNRFRLHPEKYYRDMMVLFLGREEARDFSLRLFLAQYKGEVVAAALIGYFGKRATFLHGASSDAHKNSMAPYLLHWEIMRHAQSQGYAEYDLWGIVTERTSKAHRKKWEGFSRFKLGFGGSVVAYPGAHDLPLHTLWYTTYRIAKKIL